MQHRQNEQRFTDIFKTGHRGIDIILTRRFIEAEEKRTTFVAYNGENMILCSIENSVQPNAPPYSVLIIKRNKSGLYETEAEIRLNRIGKKRKLI